MDNFAFYGIVGVGETYPLTLYARKQNDNYEWEDVPVLTFSGRPANNKEIKTYRIQQGVNGNNSSVYVFCSQLPAEIKPQDHILFNGEMWVVESIGYYYDNARFVNAGLMSKEYIESVCPKGIVLQ